MLEVMITINKMDT